eukprot:jgi/Chlat1/6871/Chrsp51S06545
MGDSAPMDTPTEVQTRPPNVNTSTEGPVSPGFRSPSGRTRERHYRAAHVHPYGNAHHHAHHDHDQHGNNLDEDAPFKHVWAASTLSSNVCAQSPKLTTPLKGSCHCGAVSFTCATTMPYPFMVCHCPSDRKTAGFYCINLSSEATSLQVSGSNPSAKKVYRAPLRVVCGECRECEACQSGEGVSMMERHFCGECGSMLWGHDRRYPNKIYPFASSLDMPLPEAPEEHHVMTKYKPHFLHLPTGIRKFQEESPLYGKYREDFEIRVFPEEGEASRTTWHKEQGLYAKGNGIAIRDFDAITAA